MTTDIWDGTGKAPSWKQAQEATEKWALAALSEKCKFSPIKQYGTKFHDAERFVCQILDGTSTSDAKEAEPGDPNWRLMAETYGDELVKRWNAYEVLYSACESMIAISSLWVPEMATIEHAEEARALHAAREKILAALAAKEGM
jgi:hypothetical protein